MKQEGMDVVNSNKPKHDGYSHYRSALEYMALGFEDIRPEKQQVRDKFPKRDSGIKRKNRIVGY